jgi:hypothetical protein
MTNFVQRGFQIKIYFDEIKPFKNLKVESIIAALQGNIVQSEIKRSGFHKIDSSIIFHEYIKAISKGEGKFLEAVFFEDYIKLVNSTLVVGKKGYEICVANDMYVDNFDKDYESLYLLVKDNNHSKNYELFASYFTLAYYLTELTNLEYLLDLFVGVIILFHTDLDKGLNQDHISYTIKPLYCTVFMENTTSPVRIAETLIHEGCHSYLNMILDYEGLNLDSKSYYSPYKNTQRPTSGILHAVMAFSTLIYFFETLLGSSKKISTNEIIYLENRLTNEKKRLILITDTISAIKSDIGDSKTFKIATAYYYGHCI